MKYLPIYIRAKDVERALNVSRSTAYRMLQKIKSEKYKKVTAIEFCKHHEIDLSLFYQNLRVSSWHS